MRIYTISTIFYCHCLRFITFFEAGVAKNEICSRMIIDHSIIELKSECINKNLIDLVKNRLPWMQLVLFPLSF